MDNAKNIQDMPDEELENIIRRGENINVPESQWNKAKIEEEIRSGRKSEKRIKQSSIIAVIALIIAIYIKIYCKGMCTHACTQHAKFSGRGPE